MRKLILCAIAIVAASAAVTTTGGRVARLASARPRPGESSVETKSAGNATAANTACSYSQVMRP